jgi:molecular chaperone IbpA
MRNYDFSPLWRSSIGFDRLFNLINSQIPDNQDGYPPYDIVRTGEDTSRIVLAIAGFSPDDLTITAQQNLLAVSGRKAENPDHEYLHHGVSTRAFERRFSLADHVEVTGASHENGLLRIDLERKLPETMKPRRIEIGPPAGLIGKANPADRIKAA